MKSFNDTETPIIVMLCVCVVFIYFVCIVVLLNSLIKIRTRSIRASLECLLWNLNKIGNSTGFIDIHPSH